MNKVQERVAKGVAKMDKNIPGWWETLDLNQLDMSSTCNCIAGQQDESEERNYNKGIERIFGYRPTHDEEVEHGFETPTSTEVTAWGIREIKYKKYLALQEEWLRVIHELRQRRLGY